MKVTLYVLLSEASQREDFLTKVRYLLPKADITRQIEYCDYIVSFDAKNAKEADEIAQAIRRFPEVLQLNRVPST